MNRYMRGQVILSQLWTGAGNQITPSYSVTQQLYAVAVAQSMLLMEDFAVEYSYMDATFVPKWRESEAIDYLIGILKSIADTSVSRTGGSNRPSCK